MSKLFFRSHSNFSSLFLSLSHTHTLSLPVWNRKKSRKRSGSVIVVRCVFVVGGGVTTRRDEKMWRMTMRMRSCVRVLCLFFCALRLQKQKNSQNTNAGFLCKIFGDKIEKRREILSWEKERKEERRAPSHYRTKKIVLYNHHHHHHHENTVIMLRE